MKDTQAIAYTEQRIDGHVAFMGMEGGPDEEAYRAGADCAMKTLMQYLRDTGIFKRTVIKDADGSKTTHYIAK